jgi:hypothetical protein
MVRGREFTEAEELSPTAPRVASSTSGWRGAVRRRRSDRPDDPLLRASGRDDEERRRADGDRRHRGADPRRAVRSRGGPAIYEPWGRNYRGNMFIHVARGAGGREGDLLSAIRREIRAYDPRCRSSRRRRCTRSTIAASSCGRCARRALFLTFGLLALLLAVVGLYGVKSYIVSQRTREIGIRMALGARPATCSAMVLKEGALLSAVGVALGPAAGGAARVRAEQPAVRRQAARSVVFCPRPRCSRWPRSSPRGSPPAAPPASPRSPPCAPTEKRDQVAFQPPPEKKGTGRFF